MRLFAWLLTCFDARVMPTHMEACAEVVNVCNLLLTLSGGVWVYRSDLRCPSFLYISALVRYVLLHAFLPYFIACQFIRGA